MKKYKVLKLFNKNMKGFENFTEFMNLFRERL